jgi:hypothetical protein
VVIDIDFDPATDLVITQNTLQANRKAMIFENVGAGGTAATILQNWIRDSQGDPQLELLESAQQVSTEGLFGLPVAIQINLGAALSQQVPTFALTQEEESELPSGGESGLFYINENSFEGNPIAIANYGPGEVTDGGSGKPVGNWFGSNDLATVQSMLLGNVEISPDPFRLFPLGTDTHPEIPGWQFRIGVLPPPGPGGIPGFVFDQADIRFDPPALGLPPDTPGDAWYRFSQVNLQYPTDPLGGAYPLGGAGTGGGSELSPAAGGDGTQQGDECATRYLETMNWQSDAACGGGGGS